MASNNTQDVSKNLSQGLSSQGQATRNHVCESSDGQNQQKAKSRKEILEEKKKAAAKEEEERAKLKEQKLLQEQKEMEELEAFKNQDRIGLEMIHAFGTYTGFQVQSQSSQSKNQDVVSNKKKIQNDFPQIDVKGHVHVLFDKFGLFQSPESFQANDSAENNKNIGFKDLNLSISQSKVQEEKLQQKKQFENLMICYPVGRHLAFRSLQNNFMKFLKLPNDVMNIQAIAFSNAMDKVAVAVRIMEPPDLDRCNLSVLFYQIERNQFKKKKDEVIKLTQTKGGMGGIPQQALNNSTNLSTTTPSVKKQAYFERYVQSMAFSHDDRYFVVNLRNGTSESYVQIYDYMIMKGKVYSQAKFDQLISNVKFIKSDSSKIIVAGQNIFQFYSGSTKTLQQLPDFEDVPMRQDQILNSSTRIKQTFVSFCYQENDQLLCCSNIGDVFVIEIMSVVQIIKSEEFVLPGTQLGNRMQFKKIVANKFGFVIHTPDILYFFEFRPWKGIAEKQGKHASQKSDAQKVDTSSKGQGISTTKLKGTYHCILKWRAEEFRDTEILDVSVFDGLTPQDSTITVSTKDGQIIFLNLYSQIYFPDHVQIMKNLKSEENRGEQSERSSEEEEKNNIAIQQKKMNSIKCLGIDEERSVDFLLKEHQKKKINTPEEKLILDQLEEQVLIDQINYNIIGNGFHKGEISCMDICIHRPIIATLSKGDSTVRVWNYSSGLCELEKSYLSHQKEFQNSNQTYLQSIALHPSGLIMAIGFIDKVKIFHIMNQEIREFQSLVDIRNCSIMKFSNGGQVLACVGVKDINLFYTFALEKPRKIACPSNLVSQIDFNYDDSIITVVSKDGFIRKYDIIKDQKSGEGVIDKQVEFSSCIFSKCKAPESTRNALILDSNQSQNSQVQKTPQMLYIDKIYTVGKYHTGEQMIRCYNEKENIENPEVKNQNPFGSSKYTDIVEAIRDTSKGKEGKESDISLNSKGFKKDKIIRNLIISNSRGQLFIYGNSPNMKDGRECEVINAHVGSINCLKIHHDSSILVSAGSDGVIIVYQILEVPNINAGLWSKKTAASILKLEKEKKLFQSSLDFGAAAGNQQLQAVEEQNDDSVEHSSRQIQQVQPKQQQKQENSDSEQSEEVENLENQKTRKHLGIVQQILDCVDSHLSNISLIEKQTMEEWRKQQEDLKQYMEKQNSSVEEKLKNARNINHKKIDEMEKRKSEQLNQLMKEYQDLKTEEGVLKDENTQTMKTMEVNHLECIEELQSLYEKKLQMEQTQYNKLKQAKDEEQAHYEERIKQMQRMSEQAIEKLLNDFKDELQVVQDEYDKAKRKADGTKMKYEEKLTQQDDDDTGEIRYLRKINEEEIQQLNDVIETIKEDIETIKRQAAREESERENFKQITEKAKYKKQFRLDLMKEKVEEIQQLEQEKKEIQQNLKQKEMKLFNLKFQIKDLQKTKQVLTHRTQEMKASLEPKEQQIETLKDQLLDLEKCFEKQTNALKNLDQEVEQRQKKIKELQNKVHIEKNNTKEKERIISDFVNAVHKAYKNKNEDKCIEDLMDIYKKYVKDYIEEILENKKKDPETIEELERQLQYMEKSIDTLKLATAKIQRKTKVNITNRRQENNDLIQDLNDVRESKKKLEGEKKNLELEIQKLKLEKQKKERDFERKLYSLYKRVNTKEGKPQENDQDPNQIGDQKKPGETEQKQKKGYLYKGTPFLRGNAEDKQMIIDLEDKIKDNSEQVLLLTLEKRSLQEQIIRLLNERADQFGLTEEEKRIQLNKLNFGDALPQNE